MPTRILLALSTVFAVRGGIPRFNQMFCLALDQLSEELDLECKVLSIDDTLEHYRQSGEPWSRLELQPCGSQLGMLRKALALAVRDRPELMVVGILGMSPLGALCSPFLGKGFAFFAHGNEVWTRPRFSRLHAARRARRVFAVSSDTAGHLVRSTGIPMSRIRVLPNTLEPSFALHEPDPAAETVGPGQELLSVARLWQPERHKGIDTTLEAFASLTDRYPEARYRIVGKGDDKPRLRELASRLGVEDRVLFEEDLSDEALMARYRDCRLFVLPSGQEGFGIVFLEAMRFAKPCIGGNVGGTPEVIADDETGFLVPFGDVQAVSGALEKLLGDDELCRRMGQAGRLRLEETFLFPSYKQKVKTYLEDWLAES